uniref:Uncharacterized protein n=1 Tax=Oryza punctata TaxID=4537 RepID=A0A0E0KLY5_ORYPU
MAPRFFCFLFLLLLLLLFPRLAAFLLAASPVLLLAAFLLALVLVYSEPNNNEPDHLIRIRIRSRHPYAHASSCTASGSSDDDVDAQDSDSDSSCSADDEPADDEKAAVWTAEDEKSIQNIGSLELERNAAVEKLMSSRSMHRYYAVHRDLIDLDGDGHLPPGSAPSMHRNPFFFYDGQQDQEEAAASTAKVFSRHESFRPYFVADKAQQPVAAPIPILEISGSSSSSSSSASDRAGQHMKQDAAATMADFTSSPKAMVTVDVELPKAMVTVDVELISDSSDDDDDDIMSLPGQQITKVASSMSDYDDGFEVESITRQVNETLHAHAAAAAAAAACEGREEKGEKEEKNKLATIEENERREHDVFSAPVPDASTAPANSATIGSPPPAATTAAPKAVAAAKSSRYKASSTKAVLGFFRK